MVGHVSCRPVIAFMLARATVAGVYMVQQRWASPPHWVTAGMMHQISNVGGSPRPERARLARLAHLESRVMLWSYLCSRRANEF